MTESPFEFTDKRRIDPETGEPREANAETPADADAVFGGTAQRFYRI